MIQGSLSGRQLPHFQTHGGTGPSAKKKCNLLTPDTPNYSKQTTEKLLIAVLIFSSLPSPSPLHDVLMPRTKWTAFALNRVTRASLPLKTLEPELAVQSRDWSEIPGFTFHRKVHACNTTYLTRNARSQALFPWHQCD